MAAVYDTTDRDLDEIRSVLVAMKEVVDEAGEDYVYPGGPFDSCHYVVANRPSCLAARVLVKLGVSTDTLLRYEEQDVSVMLFLDCKLHAPARAILHKAQRMQDARLGWGIIRQQAQNMASNYGVSI